MKLVKSLLLGSAAGLVAMTGAQAADLPSRKAAPVEYVRICSAYGAGFFFIPGTDTCLRVGGRVRAEILYVEPNSRGTDSLGFRARGRLNVDTRTATEFGTLRAFFRYELTASTGSYIFNSVAGGFNGLGRQGGGTGTGSALDKGFIQFAGFTAGRTASFFDFFANDTNFMSLRGSDLGTALTWVYTAQFGGGFSATLGVEDRIGNEVAAPGNFVYAGQRMPSIVGNLRVDQGWGSAQLSGYVSQLNSLNRVPVAVNPASPFVDEDYGFAIQAGVKINLPMLAAGDVLWLQATYAEGAVEKLGFGNGNNNSARTGRVNVLAADALVDGFGNLKKTKGYAFVGSFTHYFTPKIRSSIYGSYARLDFSNVFAPVAPAVAAPGVTGIDFDEFRVGGNIIWSPVSSFDIGVEVLYARVDPKGRVADSKQVALVPVLAPGQVRLTKGSDDSIQFRVRMQRDF